MAENTKHRSGALGRVLYTLILLLFMILLASVAWIWLGRVYDYAEQYELSRPAKTIDAYVEALNRDRWNDGVARAVAGMPHETQSDEEIRAIVQDRLSSGVSAVRKGGESGALTYSLRCGGKEIGSVTLTEDPLYRGKVDVTQLPWPLVSRFLPGILEWGLTPWIVSEDSFDLTGLYNSIEIVVPSTYSVSLNGMRLGPEYIVQEGIHYDIYEKYYNEYSFLPTKVKYRYENAVGQLEPVVTDEQGNVVNVDQSMGDFQFIPPVDAETRERLEALMQPFTEKYLYFRSGVGDSGVALANLKPYIVPDSDIDRRAKDALDGLGWAHTTSIKILDYRFIGVLPLVNNCYVCAVTATTETYTYGKGEVQDVINLEVLVFDNGDVTLAFQVD